MVYNTCQPTQLNCQTCCAVLRKQNARPCPDPETIRTYLEETTGYEGTLNDGDKVCFACYKSHLHILKHSQSKSTDADLDEVIKVTTQNIIPHVSDVKSADDAINRAVHMTVVHVAEALVRQEGLLLPDVYKLYTSGNNNPSCKHSFLPRNRNFLEEMNACAIVDTSSENKQVLTARWVLSNLTSSLQHHLSYVCKVRKYGTLLYRTYIPYRNKCLENLREQLFPEEKRAPIRPLSLQSANTNTKKHRANVETLKQNIYGILLTEKKELHNPYTRKTATQQQREDLISFYSIGETEFEKYAEYNILRKPSTIVPNRKRKLLTFSERKATKTHMNQLEKDKQMVTKCLHRRLKWYQQTGQPVEKLAEQYITFPLAISDNKGSPYKGQKSNTTKFIEK